MSAPTPFDNDSPLGSRCAIIRRNPEDASEIEMIEATWGSNPRFSDGESARFVRSEGRIFGSNRCLVPASEFHMAVGKKRYRVTLDGGNFFYLAATREPTMADWPICYRIITVPANSEVARYQARHGAIIERRDVMAWLNGTRDDTLLQAPAARTFVIEQNTASRHQRMLAL